MAQKVVHPESTYDVIELIGTSAVSWEDAAKNAIEEAAKHLRELRIADVVHKDLIIRDGKVEAGYAWARGARIAIAGNDANLARHA